MKKKNEILLLLVTIIFVLLSTFFYKQSKKITTIDEFKYVEKGGVNYKVYLTDKKYYNSDYLEEGMQYISSIIDYIDLDFKYSISFDDKQYFNVKKKLNADVKIVDTDNNDKIIYEKKETIKEEETKGEIIDILDNVKIDYKKYNSLANEFKSSYGISANCNLFLEYIIEYETKDTGIKQNKIIKAVIPLSEQMINIKKDDDFYNESSYIGKTTKSFANVLMFILSIIFLFLSFIGLIIFIFSIVNRIKNESKYDRFISKILRENDSYISISKEEYTDKDKKTIKIDSFKELLDVRNNIEKPIIYTKIDDNTSKFVIVDAEIYEYVVTRKEID